jgi:hypothetical protein
MRPGRARISPAQVGFASYSTPVIDDSGYGARRLAAPPPVQCGACAARSPSLTLQHKVS